MNVELDPKDQQDLEAIAQAAGKEPGELLRELLHKAIAEQRRNGEGEISPVDLMRYRGLGKEIWQGEEAEEYVHRLRTEWR